MIVDKNNIDISHFLNATLIGAGERGGVARMQHLTYALDQCSIPGEIMEFGVNTASTTNFIADQMPNQPVYGFDVFFEGLPEDWIMTDSEKADPDNIKHKKGHFSRNSLPEVNSNVELIVGFFDKSLEPWLEQNNTMQQVKFLHLDADLYSSTIYVLDKLNDYIVKNTIIVFDEMCYFNKPDKNKVYPLWREGEWKALCEWIEKYDRSFEVVSISGSYQCCIRIVE